MAANNTIDPNRIYAKLLNTQLQTKNNPLFQVLHELIRGLGGVSDTVNTVISGGGGSTIINNVTQNIFQLSTLFDQDEGSEVWPLSSGSGSSGGLTEAQIIGRDLLFEQPAPRFDKTSSQGGSNTPGPQGPPGIQGLQGIPGFGGLDGDDGSDSLVPGPTGNSGPQGIQGLQGFSGPIGPPSLDGEDGLDSITPGPQGNIGPQGIQGPQGQIGSQGIPGIALDGEDGNDAPVIVGPQGVQGIQGQPGIQGDDGEPGEDSLTPGPQGNQGIQGIQGQVGPQGIPGIGLDGYDGEDAIPIPGQNGTIGSNGAPGPPGQDGDIGDDSGALFVYTPPNTTPTEVNLVSVNTVLAQNQTWVIPQSLEIANNVTLEIPTGSTIEITGDAESRIGSLDLSVENDPTDTINLTTLGLLDWLCLNTITTIQPLNAAGTHSKATGGALLLSYRWIISSGPGTTSSFASGITMTASQQDDSSTGGALTSSVTAILIQGVSTGTGSNGIGWAIRVPVRAVRSQLVLYCGFFGCDAILTISSRSGIIPTKTFLARNTSTASVGRAERYKLTFFGVEGDELIISYVASGSNTVSNNITFIAAYLTNTPQ